MSEQKKFGAVIILAVVFAIGALFGVGGTVFYLKQSHDGRGGHSSRSERSTRDIYRVQVDRMTERLEESLNLTAEQIPLVRAEIQKFGNAMREVHESMRPQFHALMEERSIAIERHLTKEQLVLFREDRKKYKDRGKSHRDKDASGGSSSSGPSACAHKTRCKGAV